MGGETFLNLEIYDIVKYAKSIYPNMIISILSNGSVPPQNEKYEIIKYVDSIGFSFDGATKEVFEKIRTPLRYEHVIKCIKKWVEIRNKYNPSCELSFAVALSTLNFHELPDIVRLAHTLGLNFIYVQPMYVHPEKRFDIIRNTSLVDMDKELGHKYLKEAYEVSSQTGIRIDTWESIRRMFGISDNEGLVQETLTDDGEILAYEFNPSLNKYCQRLSCLSLKFDENGELDGVCTSMKRSNEIANEYKIPRNGTPFEIYNSKGWWQLRKDLLEGKLLEECKDCHKGNSYYYSLAEKIID